MIFIIYNIFYDMKYIKFLNIIYFKNFLFYFFIHDIFYIYNINLV